MKFPCRVSNIRSLVKARNSSLQLRQDVHRLLWLDYILFLKKLCKEASRTAKESSPSTRVEVKDVLAAKPALKSFCYRSVVTSHHDLPSSTVNGEQHTSAQAAAASQSSRTPARKKRRVTKSSKKLTSK